MITENLTNEQIEKLLASPANAQLQVMLEKFGFNWTAYIPPVGGSFPESANIMGLYSETVVALLTASGTDIAYWLRDDGGDIISGLWAVGVQPYHIRVIDNTRHACFTNGADLYTLNIEMGAVAHVATASHTITGTGGASTNRIYMSIAYSEEISRFCYFDGTGIVYTDIYWPYAIHSFEAKRIDDETDVIVISGDGVPYKSVVAQGAQTGWVTKTTTLVASFVCRDGAISDHYEIASGATETQQVVKHAAMFSCPKGAGVIFKNQAYGVNTILISTTPTGRLWEVPIPLRFELHPRLVVSLL